METTGSRPGGIQIQIEDPDGNAIEPFEPARRWRSRNKQPAFELAVLFAGRESGNPLVRMTGPLFLPRTAKIAVVFGGKSSLQYARGVEDL